jgi:hypothetical protein
MQAITINSLLPAEVLERVFRLLPPRALKAVVLVCRRWREVGEAPALWAWVCLRVSMRSLGSMPGLLRAARLQAVTRLTMVVASDDLLQAVASHPGLRVVDMNGFGHMGRFDPSAVRSDLLAAAFSGLEELAMEATALTREQLEAILAAITGYRRLKRLKLRRTKLTSMRPGLLVGAISGLEEADLNKTCLTKLQVEAILAAVRTDGAVKLHKLNMGDNGVSFVEIERDERLKRILLQDYTNPTPTHGFIR